MHQAQNKCNSHYERLQPSMESREGKKRHSYLRPGGGEVLNDFFALVFSGKCSTHTTQVAEGKNEELPTVKENQVQDHLRKLKVHKSIGPDEMQLHILREHRWKHILVYEPNKAQDHMQQS